MIFLTTQNVDCGNSFPMYYICNFRAIKNGYNKPMSMGIG